MLNVSRAAELYCGACQWTYIYGAALASRFGRMLTALSGAALLLAGLGTAVNAHAQNGPDYHIVLGLCKVLYLTEGSYGVLVMSIAGLVAIVSAAMGAYKTAMNLIIVGVGAYLIRPMIFVFFGDVSCSMGSPFPRMPGG
jgi:hypothetical protein